MNYIEIEGCHNNGKRLYVVDKGSEGYFMVIADESLENAENENHKPINQALYYALLESNHA